LKKTTERLSGATGLTKLEITAIFFIVASLLVGSGFFCSAAVKTLPN